MRTPEREAIIFCESRSCSAQSHFVLASTCAEGVGGCSGWVQWVGAVGAGERAGERARRGEAAARGGRRGGEGGGGGGGDGWAAAAAAGASRLRCEARIVYSDEHAVGAEDVTGGPRDPSGAAGVLVHAQLHPPELGRQHA